MTWWPPDQDGTLDPVERLQDKSDLRLFKAKETTTIFSVKVKLLKNSLDREGVLQHQFAGNLQCCYSKIFTLVHTKHQTLTSNEFGTEDTS